MLKKFSKLPEYLQARVQSVAPVHFFIVVAAVSGLLFLITTPPFQTPDEPVHFFRAYQISAFNFVVDGKGNQLPRSLKDTVVYTTRKPDISFASDHKYDGNKTLKVFSYKTNSSNVERYDLSATASYPPVSYIPQVTGISLGRIVGISPVGLMYLGRLANLVAWIILFGVAIRLMPRKKWALVFIGLLPTCIFQAVSLGIDVMVIGILAVFLASILNLAERKQVTTKQLFGVLALGVLLALTKQAMFVFLPLVLLLPNRLFSTKKRAYVTKAALVIIPFVVFVGWMFVSRTSTVAAATINNQNPVAQLKFIIKNPESFINVMWNTYFYTWGDTITRSFVGTFGWADAPISELLATIAYIGLFVVFVADAGTGTAKVWLGTKKKMLVGLLIAVYWVAASAALYVYYSPVGFKIIVGLQGRYFIPLAVLAIPLVTTKWLRTSKTAYKNIAVLLPVLLLIASLITLYVRYYINNV